MPLPIIIGGIAALSGIAGIGTGIHGGLKMKEARDTMKEAQIIQENAVSAFDKRNDEILQLMDRIGKKELEILSTFDDFADLIEKIQERPAFKAYKRSGVSLPEYEAEELKKISAGAGLLLGGLGGAAIGTAGGFAAAGATTSAVMAVGTASTGTAISSLSGIAATNATLAALGGGSLAAGGGGMALGSAVLGGATLGVGLLVGGIIFNATGSRLSGKAGDAHTQALRTEKEVNQILRYYDELSAAAGRFEYNLNSIDKVFRKHLAALECVVTYGQKTDWKDFTEAEKTMTENTVLLVGLLYKMCQVKLVLKSDDTDGINRVNLAGINKTINEAKGVLSDIQQKKEKQTCF